VGYAAQQKAPTVPRRVPHILHIALAAGLLVFGALMAVVGGVVVVAAYGYGEAGTMASAPACPAGVNPTTTTRDCAAHVTLISQDGVGDDGQEEHIELFEPPRSADKLFFPTFPGDQAFVTAVSGPGGQDSVDHSALSVVRA
jgi:hypothetical protein